MNFESVIRVLHLIVLSKVDTNAVLSQNCDQVEPKYSRV